LAEAACILSQRCRRQPGQVDAGDQIAAASERHCRRTGPDTNTATDTDIFIDHGLPVERQAVGARHHHDRAEWAIVGTACAAVTVVQVNNCGCELTSGRQPGQRHQGERQAE